MISIRCLTASDVSVGMRLKQQAGWNQLDADWLRFLEHAPHGCFLGELDGTPVATLTTWTFDRVAWIAMVLVEASVRGRGIGKAMMTHALAYLDAQGVRSVRLDATPLGQPLYEQLGFASQFTLARHEGTLPPAGPVQGVDAGRLEDLESWAALDREVTRTQRRPMLARFFREYPGELRAVRTAAGATGFLFARPGSRALQIGPCVATAGAGPLLFRDAWHRHAGRLVYIDIPTTHATALAMASAQGLQVQRQLVRMCRGEPLREDTDKLWASSGPEKG